MKKFKNVVEAYNWCLQHPKLKKGDNFFKPCIKFEPFLINSEVKWLIEGWPNIIKDGEPIYSHDSDLDTCGSTAEEAIIAFSYLVLEKYGDYEN